MGLPPLRAHSLANPLNTRGDVITYTAKPSSGRIHQGSANQSFSQSPSQSRDAVHPRFMKLGTIVFPLSPNVLSRTQKFVDIGRLRCGPG